MSTTQGQSRGGSQPVAFGVVVALVVGVGAVLLGAGRPVAVLAAGVLGVVAALVLALTGGRASHRRQKAGDLAAPMVSGGVVQSNVRTVNADGTAHRTAPDTVAGDAAAPPTVEAPPVG